MGYPVQGGVLVLVAFLKFILYSVINRGSLENLKTLWKENLKVFMMEALKQHYASFYTWIELEDQSVKNAFEPHLNTEVAQIFLHYSQPRSLRKFALNDFLPE